MSAIDETALYEIVELDSGEVVLCKAEEHNKPLLSVRFSRESLHYLDTAKFEVAKAMIEAGLDALSELSEAEDESDVDAEPTVLH